MREEKSGSLWQTVITVLLNLLLLVAVKNVNASAEKLGENGERVLLLQRELARQGYYSAECDGSFSPALRTAVKRLQLRYGLEPTGVADYAVFDALGLDASHPSGYFTAETELLARFAHWCCPADSYDEKRRLCVNILSRLGTPGYPDTIAENLLCEEFDSFRSAVGGIEPDTDSLRAARDSLTGF